MKVIAKDGKPFDIGDALTLTDSEVEVIQLILFFQN